MLNIGRLGAGRDAYYLDAVASGVEDYYTGAGEAPGTWVGSGCATLGLEGQVDAETLRAVLAGVDPATGEQLGRAANRRLPGFDLTLRPPKSVSVLYGLGTPAVAGAVRAAHDVAVAAALGYLEREATWSRRGRDGHERVAVEGLVAAAFVHRTSRAGDPLLHTHAVVVNSVRAVDDGQWRTLDGRLLYTHAKTAGYLYQVQLRHQLTRRLGIEWGPVTRGYAEVTGIPRQVLEGFSRRRREIVEQLAERGETSARAAQVATLVTRPAKDRALTGPSLRDRWAARAVELGFDATTLEELLGRTSAPSLDRPAVRRTAEWLQGPEGLTAYSSTFGRREVIRGWAEHLPAGMATAEEVLGLADAFLAPDRTEAVRLLDTERVDTIRRADGRLVRAAVEPRWSTPDLLELERHAVEQASASAGAGLALVGPEALDGALRGHPSLGIDQRAMVERLGISGAGVDVIIGKAGAGKTYALSAAHAAWRAAGVQVLGCALAARAAVELQDGTGIASTTIARLMRDVDERGAPAVFGRRVLVVDEGGMVGTRTLAGLLDHAGGAGCKVVLVGDPRQLPEIQAGGLFSALARRLPAVELVENRRQCEPWERAALDQLRDGDPAAGIAAIADHGRLHTAPNAPDLRARLAADWWDAHRTGQHAVMVALRRSDVDDLNAGARAHLAAAGLLSGAALPAGGRDFRAGDRVVCTRNNRLLGVNNGTVGTVFHVDLDRRELTMGVVDGTTRTMPAQYLDAGHLTHGFAVTGHKAQGATVDHAFVLGSDELYREWGYVALSRARDRTDVYVVADGCEDATLALTTDFGHSRAQQLASSGESKHGAGDRRSSDRADALDHAWEQARAEVAAARARLEQIKRERGSLGAWGRLSGGERLLDDETATLWTTVNRASDRMRVAESAARELLPSRGAEDARASGPGPRSRRSTGLARDWGAERGTNRERDRGRDLAL